MCVDMDINNNKFNKINNVLKNNHCYEKNTPQHN